MERTYWQRLRTAVLRAILTGAVSGAIFMMLSDWTVGTVLVLVTILLLLSPLLALRADPDESIVVPTVPSRPSRPSLTSAARTSAEDQLPDGWELGPAELERYSLTRGRLTTYGVAARGPGGAVLCVALTEEDAYDHLVRAVREEAHGTTAWIARFEATGSRGVWGREVATAVALPPGWVLGRVDRERFRVTDELSEDTYGVAATRADGTPVLAVARTEQEALSALQQHAEGGLAPSDHWVVRL